MQIIPLTRDYISIVDDADFYYLSQWKWRAVTNGSGYVYAGRREGTKLILLHKEILKTHQLVDHFNGLTLDNRRENLREATRSQNGGNRVKLNRNSTSGLPGVSLHKNTGKWQSSIRVDHKRIHIGLFMDKEAAFMAYKKVHKENFGEFSPY